MKQDKVDAALADYVLAEYICFLMEYIYALLHGCAIESDDCFSLDERYLPDHPVMLTVRDLLAHH